MQIQNILFLGAGRMGGAILRGWAKNAGNRWKISVIDPTPDLSLKLKKLPVSVYDAADALPNGYYPDAIVVAVKPQIIDPALHPLSTCLKPETLIISVAAGVTLSQLQALTNPNQPVVRCMPNLAAEIGQSATVAVASSEVSTNQNELADQILGAIGSVHWSNEEDLLHAVTAIAGSGPAYVFAFAEALLEAADSSGLPDELGLELTIDTIAGAAALLKQNKNPADLREQVTSPGGTTQAALQVLRGDQKLDRLVLKAVSAAAFRSRELSEGISS